MASLSLEITLVKEMKTCGLKIFQTYLISGVLSYVVSTMDKLQAILLVSYKCPDFKAWAFYFFKDK
jgi:hypothetical protein